MSVLVIAKDGQIRDALERQLTIRNRVHKSVGSDWFQQVDEPTGIDQHLAQSVDFIVNAISLERIASDPEDAVFDELASLSRAAAQRNIPLIHLSSSIVFDGLEVGLHRETEPAAPSSHLGGLLLRMEELVKGMCSQYLILRSGPLFSSIGDNLLTAHLQLFARSELLILSDEGESCPLHAGDLARVVSAMIDQVSCGAELWGTYHYCSADYVTRYQFAQVALRYAEESGPGLKVTLEPSADIDPEWQRPLLNCEKILNCFGIKQLPWRAFIGPTVKKYFNPGLNTDIPVTQAIPSVQKENFDG